MQASRVLNLCWKQEPELARPADHMARKMNALNACLNWDSPAARCKVHWLTERIGAEGHLDRVFLVTSEDDCSK